MTRVDSSRNYYADLQVGPTASVPEIRKQYKALALKWHPDRNPPEMVDEVNAKFQLIQAAYEVLGDNTLRAQYDAARSKSSGYSGASGVRGNPWKDAAKNYPPPPRRAPAGGAKPSQRPPPPPPRPTPGAQRYSDFTKAPPFSNKNQQKDSQANYDAWQNMRSASQKRNGNPPPTPGRAPTSATRESKASDSEGFARTASQRQKAQASFGNTGRRAGFTRTGLGDEPPVVSKNYQTDRTHTNIFAGTSASAAATGSKGTSAVPDPLAQFRTFMDERQSTPYATPGGEKIRLHDEDPGLGRTRSTHHPRKPVPDSAGTYFAERPRSSSTPGTSSNDAGSEDSAKVNSSKGGTGDPGHASAGKAPASRAGNQYETKKEPYNTAAAPGGTTEDGAAGQSSGGPSTYAKPTPSVSTRFRDRYSTMSSDTRGPYWATNASVLYRSSSHGAPSGAVKSDHSSLLGVEKMINLDMINLLKNKDRSSARSFSSNVTGSSYIGSNNAGVTSNTDRNPATSFNFSADQGVPESLAGQKRFASSSAEHINTKFVDDDSQEWQFKAGNAAGSERKYSTPSAKLRSQSGRRSPTKMGSRPRPVAVDSDYTSSAQAEFHDASPKPGFSAGEWSEQIAAHHFVPQHAAQGPSASPTRRANSRKNSKPVKMTMGTAGLVDEYSSPDEQWQGTPQPPPRTASPMAMDVDTPPSSTANAPSRSEGNGVRNIPVEPNRPEWRAGRLSETSQAQGKTQDTQPNLGTNVAQGPFAPRPSAPNPFATHNLGSEDSEEFRTTFAEFKKVEPFTDPVPTGLASFADLKTTLPFESKASEQLPLDNKQATGPVDFPTAPVAPRLPPTMAVAGIRPNMTQWRKYAEDFGIYLDKWEKFNQKVLDHFAARQQAFITRRMQLQQPGRTWLESSQPINAANDYLAELNQDHDVRKQWSMACDNHQARIREFISFRDRAN